MIKKYTEWLDQHNFRSDRGHKEVDGKLRYDLIPPSLELELAKVVTAGALKYGDRNWEKGIPTDECIGAIKRHLARFQLGQEFSPHDGAHEMAHIVFWCMVLIEQAKIDQSEFLQS
jgi:hypothetical protein